MNLLRKSSSPLLSSLLKSSSSKLNQFSDPKPLTSSFSTKRWPPPPPPDLQHFPRRSGGRGSWYRDRRVIAAGTIIAGAATVGAYYGKFETVPYTKRTRFVLVSPSYERWLGESEFNQIETQLFFRTLSSKHPDSIRVGLIAHDIIDAVERSLLPYSKRRRWSDRDEYDDIGELNWKKKTEQSSSWSRSRSRSRREPMTAHLEGLDWEVMVLRDDTVNAFCLPGGKIVVFTGLLDHLTTDDEIATIIAHEVGHEVARHVAEGITKTFWKTLLNLIFLQFFYLFPDLMNAVSNLLLTLPFSRRMEMEADYIGLMLMASAGYDPRAAPRVYEQLGKVAGDSLLQDYLATHPSSMKRSQLLSQAKVMDEALNIYRETPVGLGIEKKRENKGSSK